MKITALLVLTLALLLPAAAQDPVRPVRDDIGFCWNAAGFDIFMNFIKTEFPIKKPATPEQSQIVAGISPHDDYLYAGPVYYPLFTQIKAPEVVIVGVTHQAIRVKFDNPRDFLFMETFTAWKGPYGNIAVSDLRDYIKQKLPKTYYNVSNDAHGMEHSIEAMLPFLQYMNRNVKITPLMVTAMPFEKMTEISAALADVLVAYMKEKNLILGKDIFILISADADHYGADFKNIVFGEDAEAHRKGTDYDRMLVNSYLTGPVQSEKLRTLTEKLWGGDFRGNGDTLWCGKYSVPFGVLLTHQLVHKSGLTASGKSLTGKLLAYSDTYSDGVLPIKGTGMGITAPFSLKHWVGYFSAAYSIL